MIPPQVNAGKALFNSEIVKIKDENPNVSNTDIANEIELDELEESLEDIDFSLLSKVKETMLQFAKAYVTQNKS